MGLLDLYEQYMEESVYRKLVLFGASKAAIVARERYLINEEVYCLCDNDEKKWGTIFDGIRVVSPKELLVQKEDVIIIVTSMYYKEIYAQLMDMGFKYVYSLKILHFKDKHSTWFACDSYKYITPAMNKLYYNEGISYKKSIELMDKNKAQIEKVKSYLSDEKSIEIYEKFIKYTRYHYADYRDLEEVGSQYFVDGMFTYSDNEVFVDCGCLDAESSIDFAKEVKFKFEKVYAFEPDAKSYKKSIEIFDSKEYFKNRYEVFNYGVFNENKKVKFKNDGNQHSVISETGDTEIEVVKMDDVIKDKVTFIKMDIEGVEIEALLGAKNLISEYSPKLAICIYHKIEHLWEIPLLVKQMNPNYKIYMRHHSSVHSEQVMYATL